MEEIAYAKAQSHQWTKHHPGNNENLQGAGVAMEMTGKGLGWQGNWQNEVSQAKVFRYYLVNNWQPMAIPKITFSFKI